MTKIIVVMISFVAIIASCKDQGPDVKVYMSRPDLGSLVRLQDSEKIPYSETTGWFAYTPEDHKTLLDYCLNPDNKDKKLEQAYLEELNGTINSSSFK